MASKPTAVAAAVKRRRKNPSQPGDSSRSREASEESNAETTEDAMAADDTDTGSFTAPNAPTPNAPKVSGSAGTSNVKAGAAVAAAPVSADGSAADTSANSLTDTTATSTRARRSSPMQVDAADGNESTASTYDGDISSAPASSRRAHHHVQADPTSTSATQGSAVTSGSGYPRSYYEGLATRSARLQNMPSSSSLSLNSNANSPNGKDKSGVPTLLAPPESPAPQIPHAPASHHRMASPGSPKTSSAPTDAASSPTKSVSTDNSKEAMHHPAPHGFLAKMSALDLQESVRLAIAGAGADGVQRNYKINEPPTDRPVRIYADGVFDLFHYGHALALRQAKLAFPNVYLLVGVCASELCKRYKANPVMTSAERYESLRNCRWVDEVVEDAPWVVDQAFLDYHQIDYVAHDEAPYEGATPGQSDIYRFVKDAGRFLPTRRTDGVSTSELLQRIVEGYRDGAYDKKLVKIGHPELCSNPPSERGSSNHNNDLSMSQIL